MKIVNIDPKLIKPDPLQPRKEIWEDQVKAMASSIKNEGIINPIEIDKNNIIITGELRWRASMMLGLKEVPCKVIEVTPDGRFVRQMHENLLHNTMSAWDTAMGLKKTVEIFKEEWDKEVKSAANLTVDKGGRPYEMYREKLKDLYGISVSTVSEHFSYLSEPKEVQEALKDKSFKRTKINEVNRIEDEDFKNAFKKKILDETSLTRDGVRLIVNEVKRAEAEGNKEIIKKILKEDFDGMNPFQISDKIKEIYPNEHVQAINSSQDRMNALVKLVNQLVDFFKANDIESFAKGDIGAINVQLKALCSIVVSWLRGEEI